MMRQTFLRGHRVSIAQMPHRMRHFTGNCEAIVAGSYADLCGGHSPRDHQLYQLLLLTDRRNMVAWYHESQLAIVDSDRDAGEHLLQEYESH